MEINTDPLVCKCMLHRICFTEASGVWETKVGHLKTVGGGLVQLIMLLTLLLWVCLQFSIIKVYKTDLTQAFLWGALWCTSPWAGETSVYKVRVVSLNLSRKLQRFWNCCEGPMADDLSSGGTLIIAFYLL